MVTERSTGSAYGDFRSFFNIYLNDFATTVTLNTITETKDSMNRVTASSTVSTTIKADIQWVTKKDLDHLHVGDVQIGDGMLFVKYSETISLEAEVVYNGETYRITEQIEGEQVSGRIIYKGYIIRRNK